MSSSAGTWSGSPYLGYAFEWERCNATGTDCSVVGTEADYRLRRGDVGYSLRAAVTATNGWGSVTTRSLPSAAIPEAPAVANTVAPTINSFSGPRFGNLFTGGQPGVWSGDPDLTYQWQRCDPLTADPQTGAMGCGDILDATDPRSYTPVAADVGFRLRLKETATAPEESLTAYTAASQPVGGWISFGQGTITGTHIVGQTITANQPVSTSGDLAADIQYTFSHGGTTTTLQNSTSPTYEIQPDDAGHTISIRVHVELRRVDDATTVLADWTTLTGPTVDTEPENDERPAASGDAVVGATLTATTGTWDGGGELTYGYRWSRCDTNGENCNPITDATAPTYTLAQADIGSTIRVSVTASNGDVAATSSSIATTEIADTDAPVVQDVPTVSGEAVRRSTLAADPGTWSGDAPITYAYQWQACEPESDDCEDIGGETQATYVINQAATDSHVRVIVTATNGGGSSSAASARTDIVTELAPELQQPPGLTRLGLSQPGGTLVTDGGTWANADESQLRYQWERCQLFGTCEDIDGADTPSYTITELDINTQLRARVTVVSRIASQSATSPVSDPIAAATGDADGQIVYVNEERTAVYLVNSDGTSNRLVADCQELAGSDPCKLYAPRVSPNLQTIVLENRAGNSIGDGRILVVNIDGTGVRAVTTGSEPRWSPDGTSLYLTTTDPEDSEHTLVGSVTADATGDDAAEPMVDELLDQQSVDVSPDESQLTFVARDQTAPRLGLFLANDDGTDPTRFSLPPEIGDVRSAAFSDDGASIVFTANSAVGDEATGDIRRIWEIDIDGSNLRAITPPGATYGTTTQTSTTIVTTRQRTSWVSYGWGGRWETLPPVTTVIDTETNTQRPLPHVGYDASPAPPAIASRRPSVPALVRKYAPYVMPYHDDQFLPIQFAWISRMTKNGERVSVCESDGNKCHQAYDGQRLASGYGDGLYLEYPAHNDRDDQSRLLMRTLKAYGRKSQRQVPYAYYFVGDPNPDGSFVVQYWYFYTYNWFRTPIVGGDTGEHEADWEHVAISFRNNRTPKTITFSAHEDKVERKWDGATDLELFRGTHPVVYAARGSHAMSPQCGRQFAGEKEVPGLGTKKWYDEFTCWNGSASDLRRGQSPTAVRSDLRNLTREWACWDGDFGHEAAVIGSKAEAPLVQVSARGKRFVRGAESACLRARR